MNLVDGTANLFQTALGFWARGPLVYMLHSGEQVTLTGYLRGVRSDDLFAAAMQQDQAAEINAAAFATAFAPRTTPQRLDRIKVGTRTFTVEEWRGAPNDAAPTFFKLLLRGGSQ